MFPNRAQEEATVVAAMSPHLTNPKQVAEAGERIYAERYKDQFERDQSGKFAVVDVTTGKAYLADSAIDAFRQAAADAPLGAFHLIKVGSPGAFRVGYSGSSNGTLDWVFR